MEVSMVDSGDGEPMIDSVCPLCAQMVPGSLRREGILSQGLQGQQKVAGGQQGLDSGNHVRELKIAPVSPPA